MIILPRVQPADPRIAAPHAEQSRRLDLVHLLYRRHLPHPREDLQVRFLRRRVIASRHRETPIGRVGSGARRGDVHDGILGDDRLVHVRIVGREVQDDGVAEENGAVRVDPRIVDERLDGRQDAVGHVRFPDATDEVPETVLAAAGGAPVIHQQDPVA